MKTGRSLRIRWCEISKVKVSSFRRYALRIGRRNKKDRNSDQEQCFHGCIYTKDNPQAITPDAVIRYIPGFREDLQLPVNVGNRRPRALTECI